MRLQVIDPTTHFACKSCTRCCEQPWLTLIEPEKVAALDAVDWPAAFPDMAGRKLYRRANRGGATVVELGKGEGNRCVFLDPDGLCRIHKTLGYDAKPQMCKQFPFFAARAWDADYVSANYGCRAIQEQAGPAMSAQAEAVRRLVPLSDKPARADAPFTLAAGVLIPAEVAAKLRERLGQIATADDDAAAGITGRLARMLALVQHAATTPVSALGEQLAAGYSPEVDERAVEPYASAAEAPIACRFLFAATLFPDTLPPDSTANLGFFRRLALVPRLMALTKMRGVYASRFLGRNVKVDEILCAPATMALDDGGVELLGRYLRSRIWQQFPGGTQLPLCSAMHQHIVDVNAVMFYAIAEARGAGRERLDVEAVQRGLMHVEFHLATQPRLYNQVLRGYLRGALGDAACAWNSLRMLRCATVASGGCGISAPVGANLRERSLSG